MIDPAPQQGAGATLGARIAALAERKFVGRVRERALIERMFEPDADTDVMLVYGPGGIGKSALLRLTARIGRDKGWTPVLVEARDLSPDGDDIEQAVAVARAEGIRPLLLVDAAEHVASLEGHLRRDVVPSLPAGSLVVVVSRAAPDSAWQAEGYSVREIEIGPLDFADSHELLTVMGVDDAEVASDVVAWAEGSPLALSLAADAAREGRRGWLERGAPADVAERYVRRLLRDEADPIYRGALAVAAIARTTTRGLLRDALPDIDADDAYSWLAERSYVEPVGEGLALHDVVRQAVCEELRVSELELERVLRRRVIDHFYARAIKGEFRLLVELTALSKPVSETERSGLRYDAGDRYGIDRPRPGALERIEARIAECGEERAWAWTDHPDWRATTRRFFEERPGRVQVAYGPEDQPAGYVISVTPENAPEFADDDPVLGPRLAYAREHNPGRPVVISRDTVDLTPEEGGSVQALLNLSANLRSGLDNTELGYITMRAGHPFQQALESFIEAAPRFGLFITKMPELAAQFGEVTIECYLFDYRGGMLTVQRNRAYAALGLNPPAATKRGDSAGPPIDPNVVREALKSCSQPLVLARSPLAAGDTPAERAASVRKELEAALDKAFGTSAKDQRMRMIVERAYLSGEEGLESIAVEMHVSRSTFYRLLREGAERVVEAVLAGRSGK